MPDLSIRPATVEDCPLLVRLIESLADYERLREECRITPEALQEHLFGPKPAAEAVIGEIDGTPEGFALFFTSFSTFVGKPGLYLEDLFVNPDARGKGLGKSLLLHLVKLAKERGYGCVEWSVLDWNTPAIEFYKKLGAVPMEEWTVYRLNAARLAQLTDDTRKA